MVIDAVLRSRAAASVGPQPRIADSPHSVGVPPPFEASGAGSQIVLMLTNSRMPKPASSRPYPLSLMPPNGMRGSEWVMPLTKTPPLCNRRATDKAELGVAAPDDAAQPELAVVRHLDRLIRVANPRHGGEGPNVCSRDAGMPTSRSTITVGSKWHHRGRRHVGSRWACARHRHADEQRDHQTGHVRRKRRRACAFDPPRSQSC